MKTGTWIGLGAAGVVIGAAAYQLCGGYDVAADTPHWRLTESLLHSTRQRSSERRPSKATAPKTDAEADVRPAAGNYDAMGANCRLRPGESDSELRKGMNPRPPNLTGHAEDPQEAFWVVRHGIKMSGMPAWGGHMDEKATWQVVAFLQRLPDLSPDEYHELVEASGGHHHGGPEAAAPGDEQEAGEVHVHADGSKHVHHHADGDPAAVVDRFYAALSKGDLATVKSLLDPQALVLESGGAEHSAAEYLGGHAKDDAAFLKGARQQVARRTARVDGNLAWVGSEGTLSATHDGKPIVLATSETMVLMKAGDDWKIVHIHWSSRTRK